MPEVRMGTQGMGWGAAGAAQGGFVSLLWAQESRQHKQSGEELASMCCQALLFRQLQMGTTWSPK